MSWAGFAAGIAILLLTASSVLGTLIVPRASAPRLTVLITGSVHRAFLLVTDRVDDYRARDRIEALNGPALLIGLLGAWVALVFLSFALLFWPFVSSFGSALQVTGSSMFTLGFTTPPGRGTGRARLPLRHERPGDRRPPDRLPAHPLRGLQPPRDARDHARRSWAACPAWGPEVLMRHELIDNTERLGWLYERWTEWAADVSESHTTYPQLLYFRSPKPLRSWVVGLLAVMDAAALHLSLSPITAPASARPLLRMGYVALRELAGTLGIAVDPDPDPADPIQLTRAEFDGAVGRLVSVGWKLERDQDAGLEALPRMAGQLRGRRLRARPPPRRPARPLVRAAAQGRDEVISALPALPSGPPGGREGEAAAGRRQAPGGAPGGRARAPAPTTTESRRPPSRRRGPAPPKGERPHRTSDPRPYPGPPAPGMLRWCWSPTSSRSIDRSTP